MSVATPFEVASAVILDLRGPISLRNARGRTCFSPRRRKPLLSIPPVNIHLLRRGNLRERKVRLPVSGSCGDNGGGILRSSPPSNQDVDDVKDDSSSLGDGYVGFFVRMLGLDNDLLDREQAVVALWKYSLGGKKQIDAILQFQGCLNLVVILLKSDSNSAREAAAGLLRSVSSINIYREAVADVGAIEAITTLLGLLSLTPEVKEQCLCTLWNLSVVEDLRLRIARIETLPVVISSLADEDLKMKESAGGLLATLALSESNHEILVELGIIPKLAAAILSDAEGSKIFRKEAKNALLELAKNDYYRVLIIEEGLVPVPMVGPDAYRSFQPSLYSWPSLPDGTEIEQTSKGPSRFGASELLLGLNVNDNNLNIEEAKQNAIIGRTQQQFLARIGAIEFDDERKSSAVLSFEKRLTLLPCTDGVARLVLILELEDESAVSKAAESVADASINEDMRTSFKEAGAIKKLVHLLQSENDAIAKASIRALERLSLSSSICLTMEAEGVVHPLTNILTKREMSDSTLDQIMSILSRILHPTTEMKSKFDDGPVNGTSRSLEAARRSCTSNGPEESTSPNPELIRGNVLDSSIISPLVEILKSGSPNLQRKAASILEFAALTLSVVDTAILGDMESGLQAIFHQKILTESDDIEGERPEQYILEVEEAGLAISAGCQLLTKLLDSEEFRKRLNSTHFTSLLRQILKSDIPVNSKDWVAACLIKLYSLSSSSIGFNDPISLEVTLYETIPRLVETLKTSSSPEAQEGAAVELNRIISEGVMDSTRAVASEGGIFPLVNLLGEGSERTADAALLILYNLSMDSENHAAIIAAGAVPVLRRIVLSQRPQWTRALRLLWALPV